MKKKISVLLALTLIFSMLVPCFAVSSPETNVSTTAASFSDPPRGLLLFVGYTDRIAKGKYPKYEKSDIAAFSKYTNEFVLLSGNTPYNTYGTSPTQIVSMTDIDNLSPNLINNEDDLEQIKEHYRYFLTGNRTVTATMAENGKQSTWSPYINEIFTHLDPNLYKYKDKGISYLDSMDGVAISEKLTLGSLAEDVVELVNTIVSVNPNAIIWLPFPLIEFPSFSEKYVAPFTTYMNDLKNDLGTSIWKNNIRGFYWTTEAVQQFYMPFDDTKAATGFNNPMVKAMMAMDTKVAREGKQMLWIPYYANASDASETLRRMGYTLNKTTIFDYAMLQLGYYFFPEKVANLNSIVNCINKNAVCMPGTTTLYGGSKVAGGAKITYEMELDSDVTKQEKNDLYYSYTVTFKDYQYGPCMIYAGDRNSTMNGFVQLLLNAWLGSNSTKNFYSFDEYRKLFLK